MKKKIFLILLSLPSWWLSAQYSGSGYEEGIAVYYADDLHGQATSYGEAYRREAFTAAHQSYPSGTILRVTRLDNGQSVEVRVNDKMGPDPKRKIILSRAAAMQIGLIAAGTLPVRIEKAGQFRDLYSKQENRAAEEYYSTAPQSNLLSARSPYSQLYDNSGQLQAQPGSYAPKGHYQSTAPNYPQQGSASNYNAPAPRQRASDVVLESGRALAPGISGYVIQLASYDDGTNAVSYAEQLQKQGVQHVYIWQQNGKNRVVIARFNDKINAAEYLDGLRQQYLIDGIIVQLR